MCRQQAKPRVIAWYLQTGGALVAAGNGAVFGAATASLRAGDNQSWPALACGRCSVTRRISRRAKCCRQWRASAIVGGARQIRRYLARRPPQVSISAQAVFQCLPARNGALAARRKRRRLNSVMSFINLIGRAQHLPLAPNAAPIEIIGNAA